MLSNFLDLRCPIPIKEYLLLLLSVIHLPYFCSTVRNPGKNGFMVFDHPLPVSGAHLIEGRQLQYYFH